jgi:O-antigen/teichoic acid export membrane protein
MRFGVLWEVFLGLFLSLFLFVASGPMSQLLGLPALTIILIVSIPSLAGMGVVRVAYGSSIALNKPGNAAGLMVFTSSTKLILSVSFVLLGEGAFGAMKGFGISTIISAVLCAAYVSRLSMNPRSSPPLDSREKNGPSVQSILNRLLRYGYPIGIADLTALLSSQLILIIAAATITTTEFGIFNSAYVLYLYVYSLFAPLLLSILSMFSSMDQDSTTRQMAYQKTTNFAATLSGLIGLAVVISADTIIAILFGPEYGAGTTVFALLGVLLLLFPPFGSLSSGMLLLGSGYPNYYSLSNLIAATIGVIVGFLAIPQFGTVGIVFALYATYSASTLLLYVMVYYKLNLKLEIRRSLGTVASMVIALIFGIAILQALQNWNMHASLIVALVAVEIIGLAALIRIGIFAVDDAELLEDVLQNIPGVRFLGRVLHRFARIVSR